MKYSIVFVTLAFSYCLVQAEPKPERISTQASPRPDVAAIGGDEFQRVRSGLRKTGKFNKRNNSSFILTNLLITRQFKNQENKKKL